MLESTQMTPIIHQSCIPDNCCIYAISEKVMKKRQTQGNDIAGSKWLCETGALCVQLTERAH
jgi:hypothetical protein